MCSSPRGRKESDKVWLLDNESPASGLSPPHHRSALDGHILWPAEGAAASPCPERFAEAEVLGVPRGSLPPYQPDLPLYSPGHTSVHRTRVSGSLGLDLTLSSVAESRLKTGLWATQ